MTKRYVTCGKTPTVIDFGPRVERSQVQLDRSVPANRLQVVACEVLLGEVGEVPVLEGFGQEDDPTERHVRDASPTRILSDTWSGNIFWVYQKAVVSVYRKRSILSNAILVRFDDLPLTVASGNLVYRFLRPFVLLYFGN
jgi:hypothetical protein